MNDHGLTNQETPRLSDAAFKAAMVKVIPQLRAFARSLSGDRDLADDLVQETMLKAWAAKARFVAGTNFRAWSFTILRNHYFSLSRRHRFVGEWDDLVADRKLAADADQEDCVALRDVMRALLELPASQREALILIGAGGLSYEEAAEITGVELGTVKSRVSRARASLDQIISSGRLATKRSETIANQDVVVSIFAQLQDIRGFARQSPVRPVALAAAA